jgi:hypothetical protein
MVIPSKFIAITTLGVSIAVGGVLCSASDAAEVNSDKGVATIEKKATSPVATLLTGQTARVGGILVVETAGVQGNKDKVPLSGSVVLIVGAGATEKRVNLGHFFVFGENSGVPESYAFDLMTNPEVTPPILEAIKAGNAETEVTITSTERDRSKAGPIRLPIHKSYIEPR